MIQNSILITKALSYLVFIISFLFQNDAHSSTTDDFDSLRIVHSYHQIDVIDLIKSIRNGDKKSDTTHYKPYKIYSTAIVTFGYSLNTNFSASFSTCFASHFGNPNQVNLSTLEFTPSITAYKQFIVPIQSNIFTRNNNYNITGSWIFFKYPQNTYGLGGFTQLKDAVMMDYKLILIRQLVMRKLFNALYAGVGYALDYHWNIKELNESASETDFDRYGKVKSSCSSGVISTLQFDNRKNPLLQYSISPKPKRNWFQLKLELYFDGYSKIFSNTPFKKYYCILVICLGGYKWKTTLFRFTKFYLG